MPIPTRSKSVKNTATRCEDPSSANVVQTAAQGSRLERLRAGFHAPAHHRSASSEAIVGQLASDRARLPHLQRDPVHSAPYKAAPVPSVRQSHTSHREQGRVENTTTAASQQLSARGETVGKSAPPVTSNNEGRISHGRAQSVSSAKLDVGQLPRGQIGLAHSRTTSKSIRPPFTSYQQHFSPKKPALSEQKALPIISRSSGANDPSLFLLRSELLQLACVYQTSGRTLADFEKDVNEKVLSMRSDIEREAQDIDEECEKRQNMINSHVFQQWLGNSGDNKLQRLSSGIEDLERMRQPGGLFTLCMQDFDRWLEDVQGLYAEGECGPNYMQTPLVASRRARLVPEVRCRLAGCVRTFSELQDDDLLRHGAAISCVIGESLQLAREMEVSISESTEIECRILAAQQLHVAESLSQLITEAGTPLQPRESAWD